MAWVRVSSPIAMIPAFSSTAWSISFLSWFCPIRSIFFYNFCSPFKAFLFTLLTASLHLPLYSSILIPFSCTITFFCFLPKLSAILLTDVTVESRVCCDDLCVITTSDFNSNFCFKALRSILSGESLSICNFAVISRSVYKFGEFCFTFF